MCKCTAPRKKNEGNKAEGNKLEGNKPEGNTSEGTNPDLEALVATKTTYKKALKAIMAAKRAVTTEGQNPLSYMGISFLKRPESLGKKSPKSK